MHQPLAWSTPPPSWRSPKLSPKDSPRLRNRLIMIIIIIIIIMIFMLIIIITCWEEDSHEPWTWGQKWKGTPPPPRLQNACKNLSYVCNKKIPTQIYFFNQNILLLFEKLLSYLKHFSHIWQVSLIFETLFIYLKKKFTYFTHFSYIRKISLMFETFLKYLRSTLFKIASFFLVAHWTHSVHWLIHTVLKTVHTLQTILHKIISNGDGFDKYWRWLHAWVNNSLSYYHSAVHICVQIHMYVWRMWRFYNWQSLNSRFYCLHWAR